MKGVLCMLLSILCLSGVQGKTCPLSSSSLSLTATDDWQDLKSPNFGFSDYDNNVECTWTIQTRDLQTRVLIQTVDIDLEGSSSGCYDYVEIGGRMERHGKFCVAGVPLIKSNQLLLFVTFSTDGSITRRGFHMRYTRVDPSYNMEEDLPIQTCSPGGMTIEAQRNRRYITSPNFPNNYPKDKDCVWAIKAPTNAFVVKIVVEDSDLEYSSTCSWDYVVAYDGSGKWATQLDKWCGSQTPTLYSSGSYLTLRFHSDGSTEKRGFKLSFQEIPESERLTSLSTGAIVGIVIGVLCGIIFLCICICCCCTQKKPAVPAGNAASLTTQSASGTTTSAHLTMNTAGSQVFFTTTSYTPNSGQTSVSPYSSAYAPPPYPGPAKPTPPQASAPHMGYAYTQPYAPGLPTGYPPQPPIFTAGPQGNPYLNRQQSIPTEPPPPYWMAGQYEVHPGQQAGAVSPGAEGPGAGPTSGPATQQTAQGTAFAAGPRSGQAVPAGRDNTAFVADDV